MYECVVCVCVCVLCVCVSSTRVSVCIVQARMTVLVLEFGSLHVLIGVLICLLPSRIWQLS